MKYRICFFITIFVVFLSLASCSMLQGEMGQESLPGLGNDSGGGVGKKSLSIMWWGSQTRHERTLAVLELYTKERGVEFEPEFYGFDDYISKLNTLIAANDPPDLMQMGGNFTTYIDHIEVLNEYIENGIIDTSDTDPGFIDITSLEGKIIGISSGTNCSAVAYDPALFKKASLPEPDGSWTWAEFEAICLSLHRRLGIFGFSQTENSEFEILTFYIQQYETGESFFKEPYRLDLNYSDDSYVVEYLKMLNNLTKEGAYPSPSQMSEIKDVELDPLVRGEAVMSSLYSNQFVAVTNAAERSLKLVNMPRVKKDGLLGQTLLSSQMFCICAASEQKQDAAQFLNYFVNDIAANQILQGERGVPIMKSIREAMATNLTPAEQEIYRYVNNISREASLSNLLNAPVQTEIRDIFIQISEEVKFGRTSLKDAAQKLRTQSNDVLARYKKANMTDEKPD
ncbi:MAG: carbohydrate ABC transporter substrate-binding protein [Ruminiclostridium sp.]|nr:carbohydrate ABC transporter substrate-binding protein [Ruminiclostridium sp.]